jgi:hypothetical protein
MIVDGNEMEIIDFIRKFFFITHNKQVGEEVKDAVKFIYKTRLF